MGTKLVVLICTPHHAQVTIHFVFLVVKKNVEVKSLRPKARTAQVVTQLQTTAPSRANTKQLPTINIANTTTCSTSNMSWWCKTNKKNLDGCETYDGIPPLLSYVLSCKTQRHMYRGFAGKRCRHEKATTWRIIGGEAANLESAGVIPRVS